MNINLDDKKIVKIVYRIDDSRVLEFNYKNGDLASVSTLFNPKMKEEESKLDVLSDSEMIEAIKHSSFMNELEAAKKRYKLPKEVADSFDGVDESPTKLGSKTPFRKYSDDSIEIIKKIIKMDEDGTLDEIAKSYRNNGKFVNILPKPEAEAADLDIKVCNSSIATLKNEIFNSLASFDLNDVNNNKKFFEKVEEYKDYLEKRKKLIDEKFTTSCDEIYPTEKK